MLWNITIHEPTFRKKSMPNFCHHPALICARCHAPIAVRLRQRESARKNGPKMVDQVGGG